MILLDTHAWIWWLTEPKKLSAKAADRIRRSEKASQVGIASISCWEVAMLVAKGRLGLSFDVEEWIEKSLKLTEVRLLDLTPKIAILSTRLPGNPPADPADRLLIATAKIHGCPIISRDREISNYRDVETLW